MRWKITNKRYTGKKKRKTTTSKQRPKKGKEHNSIFSMVGEFMGRGMEQRIKKRNELFDPG